MTKSSVWTNQPTMAVAVGVGDRWEVTGGRWQVTVDRWQVTGDRFFHSVWLRQNQCCPSSIVGIWYNFPSFLRVHGTTMGFGKTVYFCKVHVLPPTLVEYNVGSSVKFNFCQFPQGGHCIFGKRLEFIPKFHFGGMEKSAKNICWCIFVRISMHIQMLPAHTETVSNAVHCSSAQC